MSLRGMEMANAYYTYYDYCLLKPQSCKRVCDVIREIVSENKEKPVFKSEAKEIKQDTDLQKKVSYLLKDMGMPPHLKGYRFCRSAILMVIENPDLLSPITKQLYPDIAKIYSTTSSRVERGIHRAIEAAWDHWDHSDSQIKNKLFQYVSKERGIPTNADFISTIAEHISFESKKF